MTHKESKAKAKVPLLSSYSVDADDQDGLKSRSQMSNLSKRPRTREDFYQFCTYILEYENYDRLRLEEDNHRTPPPLDSSGSSVNSESATSSAHEDDKPSEDDTDAEPEGDKENNDDSYDLVTCYCRKPFAGRPMIECSRCLTWVHLSCARIRRTHIPDVFYCALCKTSSSSSSKQLRSPRNNDENATTTTTTTTTTTIEASPLDDSPAMKRIKRGVSL